MNIKIPTLKYNNPISETKLKEIINLLEIKQGDLIVDIGGGRGDVLIEIIQDTEAKGILIEIHKPSLDKCREMAGPMIETGQLKLVDEDAKNYLKNLELESVDCFVCLGASYVFDSYLNFMKSIMPYLKKGGFVLIGEQFWMKKPAQEYLDAFGAEESECGLHYENIEGPEELGFTYLYSHKATEYDWNYFEGIYFLEEEYKALSLPEAKRKEVLTARRSFRRAQFKYGRSTMGFGLYLFAKELTK